MASQAPPPTDLREHETLNALLERIPRKAQRGLLTQVEITLTCVDANTNYIALGTNVGIVFLYHRPTDNLERLRCESYKEAVTCVQLHEGVDHQVALGTSSGRVYLFLMPGLAQGKLTQLQKFSLDLHSQPVTSVHWSTNGMKLFSGSEAGVVAMTQVEFSEGRCKSEELLKENGPIIQLDYSHRVLLVSTTHRSLICATDNNNNVTQIGQKDRKSTGHYGACFTNGLTKSDTFIYAARPGQRIWKADCNGVVQATFIFKDLLNSAHQEIELLSYELPSAPSLSDYQFQQLVYVGEKELWSWSKQGLCIVDLVTNHVVASQNRMGEIIDLSVTKDDVFVLRQGCQRNLLRLGRSPYQVVVRSASSVLRASPIRQESPLLRAASPVDDRSTKNRSPLQFLQKSIFNKLKKSENELGIPVGEELQSDIPSVEGSGIWGPETETKPHLQKFTTQHAGKSNTLVSPTAQYPAAGSRTSIPEVRVQDNDSNSIPVQSVSQLFSDLPPIVTAIPSSSQTTSTPVQSNFSVIEPKKASASDSLSASSSRSQLFENIDSQPSTDDIVFPKPKIKKHKKKGKHKHNSGSNGAESKTDDTDSVASLEFLALQNPVSTVNSTEVQPEPGAIRHHESSVVSVLGKNTPEMSNVISDKSDPVFSKTFQEDSEFNKNPIIASTFTAALSLKDSGVAKVSTIACSKESKTQDGATQKDSQNSNSPNSKNSQKYDAVLSKELQDKELKKHIHVSGSSPTSKTETKTEKAKSVANIDNTQNQLSVLNPSQDVCRKADGNIDDKTSETANRQNDSGVFTDSPPSTVKAKGDQITGNIVDISDALAKDQLQKGFAALNIAETDKTEGSEDIYERYSWHNQTDSNSGDVSAKSTEKASESQVDVDQTAVKHIGPVEVKTPMTPEEEKQSLWFADTWAEFPTPGTIQSLSVSASHIWICDKWDSVYYSNLAGPGLNWIKLSVQGKQIAVSPDGNIVWRVHNNKAYAATKVSVGNPEGTKWIEAMKNIACVAVDNTSCWCAKTTGELLVQTDLKRERPTNKGVSVSCPYSLSQISCLNGVVWAVTSTGQLVTRAGVSQANPLGTEWLLEDSQPADMVFSKVALGPHQVGWCLDTVHRLWFCSSVSVDYPLGDRKWWQMSTQEYLVTDTSSMDKLLHIAGKLNPQQLLRVVSHHTDSPGVIGTHEGGLWLARHQAKTLQVCRSSMVGNHWADTQVLGMSSSTCWKIVCASNASLTHGSIWSQQRNGELFAFPPDALQFTKVELPRLGKTFTGLSTCQDAAWGITGDGEVYIRAGMGNHCPLGVAWVKQDLRQIGERGIVSVCCGGGTVWAVDSVGGVYQRLGVKAPSSHQLNPAWLPIPSPHITLKRVVTGLSDYMVWGWDQPGHVYVRVGVTDSLPIGTEWVPVPGVEVRELCVGGQAVWAVSPSGELFCRKGITRSNQVGDYWKRVPISQLLSTISVSGDDDVWAIDANGRLLHRETRVLARATASVRRDRQASTDEGDWELV